MNPNDDTPDEDLHPNGDPYNPYGNEVEKAEDPAEANLVKPPTPLADIEARIVADVLGESGAFEAVELERLVAGHPERDALEAFRTRLQTTHGFLETIGQEDREAWTLPKKARRELLATLRSPAKETDATPNQATTIKPGNRGKPSNRLPPWLVPTMLVLGTAAALIVIALTLLPKTIGASADQVAAAKSYQVLEEREVRPPTAPSDEVFMGVPLRNLDVFSGEKESDRVRKSGSVYSGAMDPFGSSDDAYIAPSAREFEEADLEPLLDRITTANSSQPPPARRPAPAAKPKPERLNYAPSSSPATPSVAMAPVPASPRPQTRAPAKKQAMTSSKLTSGGSKVPTLGDLPLEGALFESGQKRDLKEQGLEQQQQGQQQQQQSGGRYAANGKAWADTSGVLPGGLYSRQGGNVIPPPKAPPPPPAPPAVNAPVSGIASISGVASLETTLLSNELKPQASPIGATSPSATKNSALSENGELGGFAGTVISPAQNRAEFRSKTSEALGRGGNASQDGYATEVNGAVSQYGAETPKDVARAASPRSSRSGRLGQRALPQVTTDSDEAVGLDDPFASDESLRQEISKEELSLGEAEFGRDRYKRNTNAKRIASLIETTKQRRLDEQKAEAERKKNAITEKLASEEAWSTFSLHVSDVAFKLAKESLSKGQMPETATLRPEEFVNALHYGDPTPTRAEKIACRIDHAAHPFRQSRDIFRIGLRTAAEGRGSGQSLRLTLLLDVSGSMERADRASALRAATDVLASKLKQGDLVTLIGFARTPRLLADALPGERAGELSRLVDIAHAEGGTNLEEALKLGSQKAMQYFDSKAINRIVLITDGAANLGDARPDVLSAQIEALREKGVAFDACGVGVEDLNDEMLEALTRKGDGRYYVLNRPEDADAGFAKQLAGALRPSAKNVKVQVYFNPERVGHYRLIGYEKHRLKKEDFRNDAVDAAEMAAAETGVAVYEVEMLPNGKGPVGKVSVRFRDVESDKMVELSWPLVHCAAEPFERAAPSLQLAATAAFFAERLKGGPAGAPVELPALSEAISRVKTAYPNQTRVHELGTMIEQARRLER